MKLWTQRVHAQGQNSCAQTILPAMHPPATDEQLVKLHDDWESMCIAVCSIYQRLRIVCTTNARFMLTELASQLTKLCHWVIADVSIRMIEVRVSRHYMDQNSCAQTILPAMHPPAT